MSSTEPPAGSTPPPGEPTPPPPAPDASVPPPPPPSGYDSAPPPPPPPANYGAASYGAPAPTGPAAPGVYGPGSPGNLLDRFLARFIDGIIIAIVSVIIGVVLAAISDSFFLTGVVSSIVTAAIYLGYFAYFESTKGQTVGKMALKLKTFGPDGVSLPTMEQSVRRNIWTAFGIIGVIPVLGSIVGGLASLAAVIVIAVNINSDPQRQHFFDKFAGGTKVLKVG